VMMESNLVAGRQDLDQQRPGALEYGKSVTDACADLDMTAAMLDELARAARARRDRQVRDDVVAPPSA
jgi:3-deoxy-7-phosphoheptulonate synthase